MDDNTKSTVTVESSEEILNEQQNSTVSLSSDGIWIPDKAKKSYHEQRLGQSKWAFRLSLWGCILGFIVIIKYIHTGVSVGQMEWAGIISGTVIESVSALFFYLSNKANEKITEFFVELTKDANVKEALSLAQKIKDDAIRDELMVKLSLHLSGIDEERICKYTKDICDDKE